mmetsp:Transcript_40933/g.82081  ORF Transcript_40933/g.82081 Transcript_40933/m.82081 type:complete len:81 (-) Transcript_40933:163-405(-)
MGSCPCVGTNADGAPDDAKRLSQRAAVMVGGRVLSAAAFRRRPAEGFYQPPYCISGSTMLNGECGCGSWVHATAVASAQM